MVAGLASPGGLVPLLREYVEQGGQLLIAAGADFDPALWNSAAWTGGDGLLPLPLAAEPIGEVPEIVSGELRPFFLSFESLINEPVFQLAGAGERELRDLYSEPIFFKAVKVDASPKVIDELRAAESSRFEEQLQSGTASGDTTSNRNP